MKNSNIMKFMLPMSWGISHTHTRAHTHSHACTFRNAFLGTMHWWNINDECTQTCHIVYHGVKHVSSHTADTDKIPHPLQSVISNSSLCHQWPVVSHTHHHHLTPLPHTCTTTPHTHHHPHLPNTPPHAHTFRNALLGIKQLGNAGKMMRTHTHTRLSFCLPWFSWGHFKMVSMRTGKNLSAQPCPQRCLWNSSNVCLIDNGPLIYHGTEHMIFHTVDLTNPLTHSHTLHPGWLGHPWTPLLICMGLSHAATVP